MSYRIELICPDETKIHLLRHFYKYDGIIDEPVAKLLSEQKSKFFYSFASNTDQLLSKIKVKIAPAIIVDGKNELSIDLRTKLALIC